ncbi:MAG: 2-oxoacid:acceptor oxidoreductase family protein [Deltaproteobacteria bacterium]|nr:2-oxoacid:acceptor oxidoreductase family protein [Deltaproteobacteria bacterium]
MSTTRILCAGFGGQGALLIGKLVAQAGMMEGKHVTWLPSYGPEMRGGTANVMTVVSDRPVGSPIFTKMDVLVALNQPSQDKFAPRVKAGGLILSNASLCTPPSEKAQDVKYISVPLTEIAERIGNVKAGNMVAVGALVELTGVVGPETVKHDLTEMLEKKNPKLLEQNLAAMDRGAEFAREHQA